MFGFGSSNSVMKVRLLSLIACISLSCAADWLEGGTTIAQIEKNVLDKYGADEGGPVNPKTGKSLKVPRTRLCTKLKASESNDCIINAADFAAKFSKDSVYQAVIVSAEDMLQETHSDLSKEALIKEWGEDVTVEVSTGSFLPISLATHGMTEIPVRKVFEEVLKDESRIAFIQLDDPESKLRSRIKVPGLPDWIPGDPSLNFGGKATNPIISLAGIRSGIQFHTHGATWLFSLKGRKRWFVYPPGMATSEGRGHALLPGSKWAEYHLPMVRSGRLPYTFIQHPGEAVILPEGWVHLTVNLDEVLAVGMQAGFSEPSRLDFEKLRRACERPKVESRDADSCSLYAFKCSNSYKPIKQEDCDDLRYDMFKRKMEVYPFEFEVAHFLATYHNEKSVYNDMLRALREDDLEHADPASVAFAFKKLIEVADLSDEDLTYASTQMAIYGSQSVARNEL
eukprot:TRINITY_DN18461_c0_g2_i2.p1 TRINITY_DN18461_c0_g2~~TRINITY_DN18461_c0_g2_i2.p1  ORF type:complete len:453 (+),score=65.65 TRINITY_DN18461_c0_g2_i2:48-1406(+)